MNETANYFHNAPAKGSNTQSWCDAQASICPSLKRVHPVFFAGHENRSHSQPLLRPQRILSGLVFFCALRGSAQNQAVRFDSAGSARAKKRFCLFWVKPSVKGITKIRPALGSHLMRPYFGNALDLGFYPTLNSQSNPVAEQCDSARLSSSTGLRASATVLSM